MQAISGSGTLSTGSLLPLKVSNPALHQPVIFPSIDPYLPDT